MGRGHPSVSPQCSPGRAPASARRDVPTLVAHSAYESMMLCRERRGWLEVVLVGKRDESFVSQLFSYQGPQAARFVLAMVLVVAVVAVVGVGVWKEVPAADLLQYVSPLTGLAGIA